MPVAILDALAIRTELARKGLSQADLAQRAGLHRVTVSQALSGQPVEPLTVYRLAEALDRARVVVTP